MMARVLTVKSMIDWNVRTGRQLTEAAIACIACDSLLNGPCQAMRLPRAVDGKRVVLEWIEFRQGYDPRGLGEGRQYRRPAGQPSEAGQAGNADHRRNEKKTIGPRQRLCRRWRRERISARARRHSRTRQYATASTDRCACAPRGPPDCVAANQSSHSTSVRGARNGSVRRQPDRDGDETMCLITPGNVAQAVGRIGQPVQEHNRADRGALRLEHV